MPVAIAEETKAFHDIIETKEYRALCELQPTFDKVAVYRLPDSDKYGDTNIVKADTAKEKTCTGIVVASGDECKYVGPGKLIGHGDKIMFGVFAGVEIPEIGEAALMMREEEILAKYRKAARPNAVPPAA